MSALPFFPSSLKGLNWGIDPVLISGSYPHVSLGSPMQILDALVVRTLACILGSRSDRYSILTVFQGLELLFTSVSTWVFVWL